MYLIFLDNQLIGYTYEMLALKAFFKVCHEKGIYPFYRNVEENIILRDRPNVLSKEHIQNLVTWYSRQPEHTCYYHHYIRMNTHLIPEIDWDFRKALHKAYYELYMESLTENLNDLLDETSYETNTHHSSPFSSRARKARRFFESMHRRYGK